MARSVTAVNLVDRYVVMAGEPILDTQEGVLIIAFEDGTSRTFNWDHVTDFYHLSPEEAAAMGREGDD